MKKHILEVPFLEQMPELPRGCEVTSLSMLLQHAGINVDKMQLAEDIIKVPFFKNDLNGHLNDGFVGDMYSFETDGLGVYLPPIQKLAESYLPQRILPLSGCKIDDIFKSMMEGYPVWVITNDTFDLLDADQFQTWNTRLGELKITYRMHSVVVVGFDKNDIYVHDPLYHKPARAISRERFEKAWIQMGRQALTYR
ncbi:C39 family peptidase [Evansella tamaricis]|uniref:C39 family peptidase n=1 Tax=Evansella tamaricis TaxID=2069301 RepID=A0ABS6JDC9_9BACI|nr:C39 family peptidase [Evansella tamaricis]MBU9711204.1 C39 family peptidase [Evansella tamaricis]